MSELNPNKNKKSAKSILKDWLEQLQQESWQLELLISGLALFGILESRTLLIDFDGFLSENISTDVFGIILPYISVILTVGWRIFFINLLVHVILRGLWIGTIGLRYVSGDIQYDELKYSDRFTKYLKKKIGSYDEYIEKLEKICSVIFAYTFLLFLLFVSLILFFGFFTIIIAFFSDLFDVTENPFLLGVFAIFYMTLGLIVFIDLISLGGFKRINDPIISKVYIIIYRIISTITLSFLYRPLLYNFIDNKYTRRLFFFSIPYIFVISFGTNSFSINNRPYFGDQTELKQNGFILNDLYYKDLTDKNLKYKSINYKKRFLGNTPIIVLDKYYMDEPYPSIFFKMTNSDSKYFQSKKDLFATYKKGFNFSLFDSGHPKVEIPIENDSLDLIKANLLKNHRTIKFSIKEAKRNNQQNEQLLLTSKKDSIVNLIYTINEQITLYKNDFIKNNYLAIQAEFLKLIDIQIDNTSYTDSLNCHYYIYPETQASGFICHFNSANLNQGYHNLKFTKSRTTNKNEGLIDMKTIILPFIKTN